MRRLAIFCLVIVGFASVGIGLNQKVNADSLRQDDEELVRRGEYLATIASCLTCHTPFQEKYNDFANLQSEDLLVLSLEEHNALDEERLGGGGRPFDLGPMGVVLSPNLSSDPETGIGNWTDEEIKAAIQTGFNYAGDQLHPIMPSVIYSNMSEEDMDAIVAFLRTLPPIKNDVPRDIFLPPLGEIPVMGPEETPDPEDLEAYGTYLMTGVLGCTHCHTPIDNETGTPLMDLYLAGGQPFEGPWGIVYARNITPHDETGLGEWTEEEMIRAIIAGVREDGRRLILMPWQDYAAMRADELNAVIYYLRNVVSATENVVPNADLNPDFEQFQSTFTDEEDD